MTTIQDMYHERMARLERSGEHWQRKLAYGDPSTGWQGDRALVMYHEKITDEIVIYHELPNKQPTLIFKVPAEGFDIHRVCTLLRDADHRQHSAEEIIKRVDEHNDALRKAEDEAKADRMAEATDRLHHAFRKDTGHHIAPMTVSW